ncbi:MAG: hypothetical protein HQK69_05125 [Desulfamplus sp.]|nr:hypothetical protein [Desulfamplus sp.]
MMSKKVFVVIGAIIFISLCITMRPAQSAEDYGALIKNSCVSCHGLKKICGEVGKADNKEWEEIITRMAKKAAKKNIVLTNEQQTGMVTYLSSPKDAKTLCTD